MQDKKRSYEGPIFLLIFAGLGCFLLSFIGMGVAPWTFLRNVTQTTQLKSNPYKEDDGSLSAIGRGRKTYIREGCWHCHSQFVRPVAGEPYRYGPPSQAWESMYDVPQTFGTRRVGPDLSREAGRRSDDWHLAHLYNPRSTVPLSVMPAYPWLFKETQSGIAPTQKALDLVEYLQFLGHAYRDEIQAIVYPSLFKVTGAPEKSEVSFQRGKTLFYEHCIGCHGSEADGYGLAKDFLEPKAPSLVSRYVAASEVYATLNRGVIGSAMPSFREMPERDLWSLSHYVASIGKPTKERALQEYQDSIGKMAQGKAIYESACLSCHGSAGLGDGPAAAALNPRPKDFSRRLFIAGTFAGVMKHGVPGTGMPMFPHLADTDDGRALRAYVQSLFREQN